MIRFLLCVFLLFFCFGCHKRSGDWKQTMDEGHSLMKKGEFKLAQEKFTIASEIAEADGPKNDRFTRSISALANVFLEQSKYDEAETFFKEALEIDKRIVRPDSPVIVEDLNDIGRTFFEAGRLNRAREYFEKAYKIARKHKKSEKALYVNVLSNLASTISYLEAPEAAYDYVDEALKTAAQIENKSVLLKTIGRLAKIVSLQGDIEESEKLYKQALKIEKDYYGDDSHLLIRTLSNASDFYRNRKDYDLAEKYCNEALRLSNKYYGADSKYSALLNCHLGLIYGKKGESEKAREYIRKGIDKVEKSLGDEHPELGLELLYLGNELVSENSFDKAIPVFERSATILENSLGVKNHHLSLAYRGLARAQLNIDQEQNAEVFYRKALQIQRAIYGEESAKLIDLLSEFRSLKRTMGDEQEVSRIDAKINELKESLADQVLDDRLDIDEEEVNTKKNRKGRSLVK